MTRAVVFMHDDPVLTALFDALEHGLRTHGVEVRRDTLDTAQLADACTLRTIFADVDVAVFSSRSRCPRALIDAAPRLRGIVAPTVGTETIDVAAASARGVLVGHGATQENVVSMAEATVMLMLSMLYRPDHTQQVLRGERQRPDGKTRPRWARTLAGRTVGLVGFGRIGRAVAARLQPFGATILAARRSHAPDAPDAPYAPYAPCVEFVPLDVLLERSDVVSLHADARAGEPPLIDAAALARLKPGAIMINTARGSLIDEKALHRALLDGPLGAAALDTFAVEPLPADSPLRQLDNVWLTPHLVGHTEEMFASFLPVALDNVLRLIAGDPPSMCRNPEASTAFYARLATLRRAPAG
ncbi:NAD(P)-dependent oxidoreductase [Caballeronia sp. LZ034LL]|uniref:NAD(P)-dependent oxidoreductase n=1 Tax=Caballeronia sp. LZ034LL TaxID=3038567 RepID=UPI002861EC8F|nr:NAD(P)-dependent oxidoreductase [Caballeronia sp. LZ034LL]MDR5836055.1 NAD(P)-dependent oxidoreductase [Caballeronia sp. LZ034LL]